MTLFNELQNLMIKYRFRPNKKIAQHFLTNDSLVEKLVVLADLSEKDTVLEIGPGTGFLTRALLEKCKVVAVEIDEDLCDLLEQELPKEKLNLICEDFLKAELPSFNKVVSLPPYFQSAAIIYKLLEHDFDLGVLVFQREFAEKLVSIPGFENYCALTVLVQYAFETEIVQTVSPSSFFPKPNGESAVVVLKGNKQFGEVKNQKAFAVFAKNVFRFRNKNLANALDKSKQFILPSLNISKEEFDKKVVSLDMLNEKVGLIPVEGFVQAFNHFYK